MQGSGCSPHGRTEAGGRRLLPAHLRGVIPPTATGHLVGPRDGHLEFWSDSDRALPLQEKQGAV